MDDKISIDVNKDDKNAISEIQEQYVTGRHIPCLTLRLILPYCALSRCF